MAASSPVPIDNKVADPVVTTPPINGNTTPQRLTIIDPPKQSLRGLNKPKCIKCGNVARSRCPFQSCKNCCAKAQNPCHIHVLKQSSILPDKPPSSAAPLSEQPSPEVTSNGASWRLSSIRQLSTTFANTLRAKKPLTRKDAININKWRFSKLKEHIEGNIESENEAFDRYMWNVSLLEESFSTEGLVSDDPAAAEITSEEKFQKLVDAMKVKLRSNSEKVDSCRKRIRSLVEQQLQNLKERSVVGEDGLPYADEVDASKGLKRPRSEGELRAERNTAFSDLVDKLSKARNEDDYKSCLEMKHQLLNQSEAQAADIPSELDAEELPACKHEPDDAPVVSYSLPKLYTVIQIGEEAMAKIDAEFLHPDQLAVL